MSGYDYFTSLIRQLYSCLVFKSLPPPPPHLHPLIYTWRTFAIIKSISSSQDLHAIPLSREITQAQKWFFFICGFKKAVLDCSIVWLDKFFVASVVIIDPVTFSKWLIMMVPCWKLPKKRSETKFSKYKENTHLEDKINSMWVGERSLLWKNTCIIN